MTINLVDERHLLRNSGSATRRGVAHCLTYERKYSYIIMNTTEKEKLQSITFWRYNDKSSGSRIFIFITVAYGQEKNVRYNIKYVLYRKKWTDQFGKAGQSEKHN